MSLDPPPRFSLRPSIRPYPMSLGASLERILERLERIQAQDPALAAVPAPQLVALQTNLGSDPRGRLPL